MLKIMEMSVFGLVWSQKNALELVGERTGPRGVMRLEPARDELRLSHPSILPSVPASVH